MAGTALNRGKNRCPMTKPDLPWKEAIMPSDEYVGAEKGRFIPEQEARELWNYIKPNNCFKKIYSTRGAEAEL